MTQYTFDSDIISDLHKDAFGFRPTQTWWSNWKNSSNQEKQKTWDAVLVSLQKTIEEDKEHEIVAIKAFELLVEKTITSGAKDTSTAHRWIMDSSKCNDDWEYLCWTYGLPYGYFSK